MFNNITTLYNIHVKHNKNNLKLNKYFSNKVILNNEKSINNNRHFPPAIREWNNSVYNYNKNNYSYSIVKYNQLNNLLKNYFNMSTHMRMGRSKRMRYLRRKFNLKKTFLSKPEIKQTNDKIIITVYSLDRLRQILARRLFFHNRPNIYKKVKTIKRKKFLIKIKKILKYNIPYSGAKFLKEQKTFRKNNSFKKKFTRQSSTFLFFKYILSIFNIGIYIANHISKPKRKYNVISKKKEKWLEIKRKINLTKIANLNLEYLIWINNVTWSIEKIEKKNINFKFLDKKFTEENKCLKKIKNRFKFRKLLNYKLIDLIQKCTNLPFLIKEIAIDNQFIMHKIFNHINIKLRIFKTRRIYKRKAYFFNRARRILFFNLIKYKEFLPTLKRLIDNLYNKKTELNIVNLKYYLLNSDIFTQIIMTKLRKKIDAIKMLKRILSNISVYNEYSVKECGKNNNLKLLSSNQDLALKSLSNLNIITHNHKSIKRFENSTEQIPYLNKTKDLLNNIMEKIYPNNNIKIQDIFRDIKYKKLLGIKIGIKGRLSRRNTASRAINWSSYKGKLKDKDQYKYLNVIKDVPTVILRNSVRSNTMYTSGGSYKRVGAYGIKTWMATK